MDIYCRICSRSDDFKKTCLTTVSQISDVRIDDMLVYSTQLEVNTEDSLPQQICMECMAALNTTFLFRKMCYRSDTAFREMLKNTTFKPTAPHLSSIPPLIPFTQNNLSDITIKQEVSELDELLDSIKVNECYESTTDIGKSDKRTRRKRKIHVCNNCGYATEHSPNMKRHKKSVRNCELRRFQRSRSTAPELFRFKKKKLSKIIKDNWELDDFLNSTLDEYNEILATNANNEEPSEGTDKITKVDIQRKTNFDVCTDCGYKTAIPAYMERHKNMRQDCKKEKYRIVTIRREFHKKMKTVSNTPKMRGQTVYYCEECGYNTRLVTNFVRHQKAFLHYPREEVEPHDPNRVIYVCKECGYSINNNTVFLEHQLTQLHALFGKIIVKTTHLGTKRRKKKNISNKEDPSKQNIADPNATHIECLKQEITIEENDRISQNPITNIDT